MSYLKGLSNSVQSQGGFKKWPISDVDPLTAYQYKIAVEIYVGIDKREIRGRIFFRHVFFQG